MKTSEARHAAPITTLNAICFRDKDGNEGIVAITLPQGTMPLIWADESSTEEVLKSAVWLSSVAGDKTLHHLQFSARKEIGQVKQLTDEAQCVKARRSPRHKSGRRAHTSSS